MNSWRGFLSSLIITNIPKLNKLLQGKRCNMLYFFKFSIYMKDMMKLINVSTVKLWLLKLQDVGWCISVLDVILLTRYHLGFQTQLSFFYFKVLLFWFSSCHLLRTVPSSPHLMPALSWIRRWSCRYYDVPSSIFSSVCRASPLGSYWFWVLRSGSGSKRNVGIFLLPGYLWCS